MSKSLSWKTLKSEIVHKNPWYSVRKDTVIRPDGQDGVYFVSESSRGDGGVTIIPVNENGQILLIRIVRYTIQRSAWEVPCGGIEKGDNAELTARKELEEETGYESSSVRQLYGHYFQMNGSSDAKGHTVLMENLRKVSDGQLDEEGILETKFFTLEDIEQMIRDCDIVDAQSIAALYRYRLFLEERL
jgi:ADP-ribose pyrophosphatase